MEPKLAPGAFYGETRKSRQVAGLMNLAFVLWLLVQPIHGLGRNGQTSAQASGGTISQDQKAFPRPLARKDVALIAEAYHLWKSLGDKVWPGWTKVPIPIVYITQDYEYAIGFPKTLQGFEPLDDTGLPNGKIQARKRTLAPDLTASFDVEGVDAVIIGRPESIGNSSGEWIFTAVHEMFHVWQNARGSDRKVAELKIGSESDASWQLNFLFPYQDADVMRLIHLQGYLAYLAATSTEEEDMKYKAGAAVEAIEVYKSFLKERDAAGRFYKYSEFQEWTEGIAFYTEYKMAEMAARADYQPTKAFRQLPGFKSYRQLWEETYKNRIFLAKHAGCAARSRTAFYHLGLGKGLLLDRLLPDWKNRYFASNVWLDDLLIAGLSERSNPPHD